MELLEIAGLTFFEARTSKTIDFKGHRVTSRLQRPGKVFPSVLFLCQDVIWMLLFLKTKTTFDLPALHRVAVSPNLSKFLGKISMQYRASLRNSAVAFFQR